MSDPSIKILLVEDNDDDALLLRSMMGRRGSVAAKLERAKSVREAEEFLAPENFDIILLDLGLPDAQGIGALAPGALGRSACRLGSPDRFGR
jgi:CheY-like chemotaxis protein